MTAPGLVGDIGGTNARFGLIANGRLGDVHSFACADFAGLDAAVRAYLGRTGTQPRRAAFCVAGPVAGDRVRMTNHPWEFSIAQLTAALGLERLRVTNDFAAVAEAVPRLGATDRRQVGGGATVADAPIAVIGPGTGLGVAGLTPNADGWTVIPTEGGHVTLAAATDREAAVIARVRAIHGHVSAERLISGPGLTLLHRTLAELAGRAGADLDPATITGDPAHDETVDQFCAFLATAASNLALSLGARGGVYIAGGMVPKLGARFDRSSFRARFEAKGRFSDYLKAIPTFVITHPHPALLGLAGMV